MSETPRQTLERMHEARDFPQHTCAGSRHAALLAEALIEDGVAPSIQEEPAHCGQSIASTVASLWEARATLAAKHAEIERLREPLAMLYRAYLHGDYERHPVWDVVREALGTEAERIESVARATGAENAP